MTLEQTVYGMSNKFKFGGFNKTKVKLWKQKKLSDVVNVIKI